MADDSSESSESSPPPQLVSEEAAQQLFKEFKAHLTGELNDGARKDMIQRCLRHSGSLDASSIREAIQNVTSSFATYIQDQFWTEWRGAIAAASAAPWRMQLPSEPLQTEHDYTVFLRTFVTAHLPSFYGSNSGNSSAVQRVARTAARNVGEELDVSPVFLPGLAKLALYDFNFLCDNSGSMHDEDRIPALRDTLKRVAEIATILSQDGISIRILNFDGDTNRRWDKLRTAEDVKRKMDRITYEGCTPLGTRLHQKVVTPILTKAGRRTLKKPANQEPSNQLRDTIFHCNSEMQRYGYEKESVIFIISRVGTSQEAQSFVEGLGRDQWVGSTVYVSPADLALKRAAFENSGAGRAYSEMLVQLFLNALQARVG